jgi:peroxiredoxin Q/BCP
MKLPDHLIKKLFPLTLMILSFFQTLLGAQPLEIGSPAPQVQALTDEGESIDFGEALSSGTVLVFFYPKAMTGGCTKQACSLRDAWDELSARDVRIFGVSSDKAATQAEFRSKHSLPFTLIADTDGAVCDAFGKGRWSRHAYIFQDGELVWRDLSASTSNQAADVLAALDQIQPWQSN